MNQVAQIAADIHDAFKTCDGVDPAQMMAENNTHGKICFINAGSAAAALITLTATVSSLADSCAATLIPNMDSLCAASVAGLVATTAQIGGAAVFMKSACRPGKGMFGSAGPEVVPSNIGANPPKPPAMTPVPERRLSEIPAAERKLIFGGGKASTGTQCYLDVSNAAWNLAQAALAITSASGHTGLLGGCPPRNIFGGKRIKGPVYRWAEEYCAADVSSVITFFAAVVAYIDLAVINCGDVIDLRAICGAGIDGLFGSLSGIAQTAIGVDLTCKQFQSKGLKRLLRLGGTLDYASGGAVTALLGRRLQEVGDEMRVDRDIEDLKKRFGSPEEVWKSMGIDLDDPDADFRKQPAEADFSDFSGLMEKFEQERSNADSSVPSAQTCQ